MLQQPPVLLRTSRQSLLPSCFHWETARLPRPSLRQGLPLKATSLTPLSSSVLPLSGWPSQSRCHPMPHGGLAGGWDAEAKALESLPSRRLAMGVTPGVGIKMTDRNKLESHFVTRRQIPPRQSICCGPQLFYPPPREQCGQGQIWPVLGISHWHDGFR